MLLDEQVFGVVALREAGLTFRMIKEKTGVSIPVAQAIVAGKLYRRVTQGVTYARSKSRLSENDVREIRLLHSSGWTQKNLAIHYGISKSSISRIVCANRWADVV